MRLPYDIRASLRCTCAVVTYQQLGLTCRAYDSRLGTVRVLTRSRYASERIADWQSVYHFSGCELAPLMGGHLSNILLGLFLKVMLFIFFLLITTAY